MNPYFFLAFGGVAAFLIMCYKKTPYIEVGKQTDDPLMDKTRFISQLADPADTWSDPTNLTVDQNRIRKLKEETGPYGVPRTYYTGPGNSKLVLNGDNYVSL